MQAPGAGGAAAQAAAFRAAGAGVGQFMAAAGGVALCGMGAGDVAAGAGAGVGQALFAQLLQGLLVQLAACGLPAGGFVGCEAAGAELLDDEPVCAGHAAGCVNVFDAQQPAATVCACVQPAGEGGDEGAGMQGAGG